MTIMPTISYEDLIGRPYSDEHNCWWLVCELYHRMGIELPNLFAGQDHGSMTSEQIRDSFATWTRLEKPSVGGVVVMGNLDGAAVHVGVLVQPWHCLHTMRKTGVVLTRIDHRPWCDKILGFYAYGQ